MNKKLFADLVESMTQMNEIVRGERAPCCMLMSAPYATDIACGKSKANAPARSKTVPL